MSLKSDLQRLGAEGQGLKERARRKEEWRLRLIERDKEIARRDRADRARARRAARRAKAAPPAKPLPQAKPAPPAKPLPPVEPAPLPVLPPPRESPPVPPGAPVVQPFDPQAPTGDPPEHMQIRPVSWRPRWQPDLDDERPGTNGRCIIDYDPLADDDYDPFEDD